MLSTLTVQNLMRNFIILIFGVLFSACSSRAQNQSYAEETGSSGSPGPVQRADGRVGERADLAKIYTQAIAEYIGVVHKKGDSRLDTLFIGKVFDFPDITLPTTVGGTEIRLLTAEEADRKKPVYSPTSPYINLMGFVENDEAEFIFVAFYPGFEHQYDTYINYRYDATKKAFEPSDLRIEVLIRDKAGQPGHYAIYKDGKHVGDKPIDKK